MIKKIITLAIILIFVNVSSQTAVDEPDKRKAATITLQEFVEKVKAQNESIKNVENVNVMVNDLLIDNLDDYMIDPKNVSKMEVLVLDPKINREGTRPSIIITTKKVK